MRIFALWLCFFAASLSAGAQSSGARSPLDPNGNAFPRASQHDFSALVPVPARQKGFLQSKNGQFFWEDGSRAKFWGINVANTSLFVEEAQIEAMLRNFRASGFNLVRLHHFDERGGILKLDAQTSGEFDAERVRKLDFWIFKAREYGLSVYLDLLDYRRFQEGDGVPNASALGRAAKPVAVFDARLIELQKIYAWRLLREHKNQFNGLAYADDPTIVMLEVASENGLFIRRGLWRSLPEPYGAQLRKLWNEWLRAIYGDSARLRAAWTGARGEDGLLAHENLEAATVELPAMTWETERLSPADVPFASLPRRSDGARFAAVVHRRFFAQMRDFLRKDVGFRAPICSTGRYDDLAEYSAQAGELDFIACNYYYDHPYWGTGRPQWQLPSYFHGRHPLADNSETGVAATLGLARVRGKPFVVREWNVCWPNPHRGAGFLEAVSLGAVQDFDAMILFSYGVGSGDKIGYFDVRNDPTRWGLAALGAQIFLGGLIAPAKHTILVPHSLIDTFAYEKYHQPLTQLAWTSRLEHDFFTGSRYVAPPRTSLLVPPGRSNMATWSGAPVLDYVGINRTDFAGRSNPAPRRRGTPGGGGLLEKEAKRLSFASLHPAEVPGAALDALLHFHRVGGGSALWARGVSVADTGQITRNSVGARLTVKAPRVQIYAGKLAGVGGTREGLGLKNVPDGALVALSLDGLPLSRSRKFLVRMAGEARNSGEIVRRDPRFAAQKNGQWMVENFGRSPVVSGGKTLAVPVEISLGGRPLLRVWNAGDNWELLVDGKKSQFWSDFAGAKWAIGGENRQTVGSP